MNPLPPQAYTKETLVHAYAWLQNQSENIKELATTPDVLVSLYLKAKLQGDGALERPSIQNFKNELKNLAGMMGEFEDGETPTAAPSGASASRTGNQTIRFRSQDLRPQTPTPPPAPVQAQLVEQKPPPAAPKATPATPTPQGSSYTQSSLQLKFEERAMTTPAPTLAELLDARSMDMIQEVKIQFNLSSDSEALRLLLANGYNQIKGLLK
jgi:hypothetical protein